MPQFLTFRMWAPLMSHGDVATSGYRPSALHPRKSAVLGLLAACLGIRRDDPAPHKVLSERLGFACLVQQEGSLLSDYHTAQTIDAYPITQRAQRATVLSQRHYRQDSAVLVALWLRTPTDTHKQDSKQDSKQESVTLPQLQHAMQHPYFTPYAGRKSCPFALPFTAKIVEADTPAAAMALYVQKYPVADLVPTSAADKLRGLDRIAPNALLVWEDDWAGLRSQSQLQQRDDPQDRLQWLFAERFVYLAPYSVATSASTRATYTPNIPNTSSQITADDFWAASSDGADSLDSLDSLDGWGESTDEEDV